MTTLAEEEEGKGPDPPVVSPDPPAFGQEQQERQQPYHQDQEEEVVGMEEEEPLPISPVVATTRRPMVFSTPPRQGSNLPAGWKSAVDEKSGTTYYYNHSTGVSQWDRPKSEEPELKDDPQQPKDEAAAVAVTQQEDQKDNNKQESSQQQQPHEEETPFDEPVVVEKEQASVATAKAVNKSNNSNTTNKSSSGWKSAVDEKTGKTYYYNHSTGESVWKKPTAMMPDSESKPEPKKEDPKPSSKDLQPPQESALGSLEQEDEDHHDDKYKDEYSQESSFENPVVVGKEEKTPPTKTIVAATSSAKGSTTTGGKYTHNDDIHEREDDHLGETSRMFLDDPIHERTYGRRIASWMAENGWCGEAEPSPYADAPSLEKAWAFFEHVTLSRYVDMDKDSASTRKSGDGGGGGSGGNIFRQGDRQLELAEPGESELPTTLYPIFSTPLSQLGDFGLGFGIYFASVRSYAILTFICGLICIPNIMYFASEEYDANGQANVTTLLQGSAICTDRQWVPCPTCTEADFKSKMYGAYEVDRFAQAWAVKSSGNDPGFYLNVTDWLTWPPNTTRARGEMRTVPLNNLLNSTIPEEYNISLTADGGYILNDRNITDEMLHYVNPKTEEKEPKGTPLWCGYAGPGDCYLDLYPEDQEKDTHITLGGQIESPILAPRVYDMGDTFFLEVGFVQRNHCEGATKSQGWVNWAAIFVMFLGSLVIKFNASKIETAFDEDEQTAQDYSITIKNPPDDAYDPEEWKQFFEGALRTEAGGKASPTHDVRVVTVDVDNEFIVEQLIERREILRQIEMALPPDTPLHRASLEKQAQKAEDESSGGCMGSKIPKLVERMKEIDEEIKNYFESHTERPPTTSVFLTFETEAAQRATLSKMTVPANDIKNNNLSAVPPHYLFRGKHLLHVREAHEPSTIRWQDLNASSTKIWKRKTVTSLITIASIAISYFAVAATFTYFPYFAPILTTVFTALFPQVAIALMNYEKHHSDTSRQSWLFAKVGLYNVFITTVLFSLVTPFEATLDQKNEGGNGMPGLLPAVYALFFSQLGITPGLQLIDAPGNIQRHVLAPRAKTQDEMNLLFRGTPVYLAERYGNFIKFLYMVLWYCSIYPAIFFLGSFAFLITYFVDRFSLMRTWARSPSVGAEISYFARNYFTPIGICLMSVFSAYYWSGFPYDNVCPVDNGTLPGYYVGQFDIDISAENATVAGVSLADLGLKKDAVRAEFTINEGDDVYKHCNQDFRTLPGINFPALPQWQPAGEEWMDPEQEHVVALHGWTSVAVLVLIGLSILYSIREGMDSGTYDPRGDDQHIDFSDVPSMASYIPQYNSDLMAYPFLLCDISEIDAHLFEWTDPDKPHSYYDVTNDIPTILGKDEYPNVFARIQYWPRPEEASPSAEQPAEAPKKSESSSMPYPPKVTD